VRGLERRAGAARREVVDAVDVDACGEEIRGASERERRE
jgi:hypothetical protein